MDNEEFKEIVKEVDESGLSREDKYLSIVSILNKHGYTASLDKETYEWALKKL